MFKNGAIKKTGFFWLPGQSQEQLPGTLTIEPSGHIELEVMGLFENTTADGSVTDESQINGEIKDLGYVTLEQCFYIYKPTPFAKIKHSVIVVNQAVIGAAFGKEDYFDYHSFSFSVDNLAEWVRISGLSTSDLDKPHSHRIDFELPSNIEYMLSNDMKLTINFGYKIPGRTINTASIEQTTSLKLSSEIARPLSDFKQCAYYLNNLLSFAMDTPIAMRDFVIEHNEIVTGRDEKSQRPLQLQLVYPSTNYTDEPTKLHWQQMLFPFSSIQSDAEGFLNRWLHLYEIAEPALSLFFSITREPNVFSESKFLSLAQSLETLHRRTNSKETLMDPKAYEIFGERILAGAPEDAKEWLESKLRFGNEPTFKKRLTCLLYPFRKIIGGSKVVKRIIYNIITSRNYYTHYDVSLEDKALKGVALMNLTYTMEAICKLLYLNHIGFTISQIENSLSYAFIQALHAERRRP